jgi:hypothetical protein
MLSGFKDVVDLLLNAWRWVQGRRNPAYRQAVRILQALNAHGIKQTQINSRLPEVLRMPVLKWSSADHLKEVLNQEHIEWFSSYLKFNPLWVEDGSESPHQSVRSYKEPQRFNEWLEDNRRSNRGADFKLYLITVDKFEINASSAGPFAVVLEEFGDVELDVSRFYNLTEGSSFNHQPCLLHLMQLLAIAHCHGVIMRRSTLAVRYLEKLSTNRGFIPDYLARCKPHPLAADHEFWGHFSGNSPWLTQLRAESQSGLLLAGLKDVVETVSKDRVRYART